MSAPVSGEERAGRPRKGSGDEVFVRKAGKSLVYALHGALRSIKLYPVENATVQKALTEVTAQMQGADRD